MRTSVLILAVCLVTASAAPQKIIGGSLTTIEEYPYAVVLLYSFTGISFSQHCGGTILNNRSILTSANCLHARLPLQVRARVGSSFANSGGTVLNAESFINHPYYSTASSGNDVGIFRSSIAIPIGSATVAAGRIAGTNYDLGDNVEVWAIGWGRISDVGVQSSEQLRHVQVLTINHETCWLRYGFNTITSGMLCSGWLDVGGRDQCRGDFGGPLLHNGVVVGVSSWNRGCNQAHYPSVNARVTRYSSWIVANA